MPDEAFGWNLNVSGSIAFQPRLDFEIKFRNQTRTQTFTCQNLTEKTKKKKRK